MQDGRVRVCACICACSLQWLTSWRDPFFVPPELSPDTGRPAHIPAKATQSLTSNTAHTQPSRADKTQREHMVRQGTACVCLSVRRSGTRQI